MKIYFFTFSYIKITKNFNIFLTLLIGFVIFNSKGLKWTITPLWYINAKNDRTPHK